MVSPDKPRAMKIVNCHLKVIAGCIDASHHDLISEHEPPDQIRALP